MNLSVLGIQKFFAYKLTLFEKKYDDGGGVYTEHIFEFLCRSIQRQIAVLLLLFILFFVEVVVFF